MGFPLFLALKYLKPKRSVASIAGDSVPEELFYNLANGEAFDACNGFNLDHNLHGTDERKVLPGFFDDTGLFGPLLILWFLLLLWPDMLGDAPHFTFKVVEVIKGIRLLTHTRYNLICSTMASKACSTAAF